MPDVASYDNESDWMAACVPAMIDEGREQDQAVAACLSMWREKSAAEKAGTARNAARRALRELAALLENREIPEALRSKVTEMSDALKRTWSDLADEAGSTSFIIRRVEASPPGSASTRRVGSSPSKMFVQEMKSSASLDAGARLPAHKVAN